MCSVSDVLCDTRHATFAELDVPPPDTLRPTTPLPDRSRTLRRTMSYASIDTVRAPSPKNKGVRRSINEIAENLKRKSEKKKKKCSSTRDVPKNVVLDPTSEPKAELQRKAAKRERKAPSPLQDASHGSEEDSVLAIADRLHRGVFSELDPPPTFLGWKPNTVAGVLLLEDGEVWEDYNLPARTLQPEAHVTAERQDTLPSPRTVNVDIKDLQLDIRPFETDVTIWDGLRAEHHVFKCRLFLRCTTHPYDSVSLPDIRRVEMNCNTRPACSRYARPTVLQTTYDGATPGFVINLDGQPDVKLAAGIHMDQVWYKIIDDNGTWGWYRDAFVPLSPRLFDKMEYREFKLVSRVWVGENCVENELTFGISMLLRGVDMK